MCNSQGISLAYNVQNSQLMQDVNSFTMSDPEISSLASSHNPFEDTKKSNPVAYAFGNVLASLLLDAIPTAKLGLLDDAARGIKGFVSSKFDDLVALLKKASSATGKSGDDIVRLIAGATGKSSDDILRELAKATGKSVDDIVKAFAGVSDSGDDAARVLNAAGDNTGDVISGQADNLDAWVNDWNTSNTNSTFEGMSGKPDEVPKAPEPDFNKPLEDVPPKGYNEGAGEFNGPVEITPPPNATPEQITQTKAYIDGANQALLAGKLSPTGRVTTAGSLRIRASASAGKERARAAAARTPYKGHVGHVPDTTWTGSPDPYSWLDLDPSVNMSIGGQSNRYPIGYKPTEFIYKDW